MGKKRVRKRTVNKSEAIRKALAKSPKSKPKEIASDLSAKGIKVSAAYVSATKSMMGRGQTPISSSARVSGKSPVQVEALVDAKKLADKVGGVDEAKKLLDVLARLQ